MKRVVRTGFELTMAREGSFARHYPEQAPQMRQALQWAIEPIHDKKTLTKFLDDFAPWLQTEIALVFPSL